MSLDPRVRRALRDAGVSEETLREAADAATADAERTAEQLESFFEDREVVYSDMDLTHSSDEYPEHAVEYADLFTHSEDVRGWLRFDSWGVYVEGGRVLSDEVVELTLGPTIHERVRFATAREEL
ncbi:hypothetical protein [Halorussus sp. MSC15.2]|uniref:DUF7532 family protein n=1 Tax=Halorussus sp. MSC15.2 TaxID=2283638 RepID=UPI0013CFFC91|nr:hypothetical protein [Halorussus sp. MSC15.2]NEU57911.1 hypothetical protein [Halorussus sp. MSC15.2]